MKVGKMVMSIVAVMVPWLALLIYDNPGGAFIALVMQATIVGWIPASIWAWNTVHGSGKKTKKQQEE